MSNVGEKESVLFKRVAGGHIFQAPNPWIFGKSRRYIVNDDQKAQLLKIMTPQRPILRVALVAVGCVLWAAVAVTIVWAFSGNDEPNGYDMVAMAALIIVPMVLALMMALQRNLRRMQPILAGLPRTDERITRSEQRQVMANAMSFRQSLLIGSVWVVIFMLEIFMLVIRNARHPLFSDAQSFLNIFVAVVAAALAVQYLGIAFRKARLKKAA